MEELPDKDLRYDRGDEVVEACCALWECWDQDALVMDKARGLFIDPRKVQYANYRGECISTRGPLSIPPSPQRRPVLMQAGSSPRGREFAARWAEAFFVRRPTSQARLRSMTLSWGVHQHTRPIVDPAQPAKASGVDAGRLFTARAGVCGTLGRSDFLFAGQQAKRDCAL